MLQTPRLHLETLSPQHLSHFHWIYSNPLATQYSPLGPSTSLADSSSRLSFLIGPENPLGLNYAILLPDPSRELETSEDSTGRGMIGVVGTWRTWLHERTGKRIAEVFYRFHPNYWKKGYATEAVRAFIDTFWKERSEVQTLEAGAVDEENVGSIGVALKCGFTEVEREVRTGEREGLGKEGKRTVLIFRIEREEARES